MLPWLKTQQARGLRSMQEDKFARATVAQGLYDPQLHRPRTGLHPWWSGGGGGITEYDTRRRPPLHATSPGPAQTSATCQSRLTLVIVKLYAINFTKHRRLSVRYESLLGLLKLAHAESWSWMGIFCKPKSFSCYFKFQRKTSILSCQAVVTSVVLCGNFSSRKNMKTFSCKVLPFISWLCKIRYSRLWERNLSF